MANNHRGLAGHPRRPSRRLVAGAHADDVARRIRSEERREAGLLTLNVEVTAMYARFDALFQAVEQGQATSQYLNAITALANLRQLWEGSSSGVIADKAIVEAYTALDVAAHERLPDGSAGARRQRELSTGDKEVGQRFVRDLGHVLGLLGEFKREVQRGDDAGWRGVALPSGRRGRRFKSGHPDQLRRHMTRAGPAYGR